MNKSPDNCPDFLLFFNCVFSTPVNHKFAEQKFQQEIGYHSYRQNQEIVTALAFCHAAQPGGQGGKHHVKAKYFCHGNGNIGGGLEGVSAIEGKVPKNGKHQRGQIRDPVILDKQLQQSKRADLNDACGNGKHR